MKLSPEVRLRLAWFIFIGCAIGWPLSMFTVARGEPPFILSLSWLALMLTAWDVINTSDVRREQDDA